MEPNLPIEHCLHYALRSKSLTTQCSCPSAHSSTTVQKLSLTYPLTPSHNMYTEISHFSKLRSLWFNADYCSEYLTNFLRNCAAERLAKIGEIHSPWGRWMSLWKSRDLESTTESHRSLHLFNQGSRKLKFETGCVEEVLTLESLAVTTNSTLEKIRKRHTAYYPGLRNNDLSIGI